MLISNCRVKMKLWDDYKEVFYLDMFTKYLTVYQNMLECKEPTGTDYSVYSDFDSYMKKLDPVAGYLSSKFGKDKAESLVNDFLFCYG